VTGKRKRSSVAAPPRESSEYFRGDAFEKVREISRKIWDARNFPGLWLDNETSPETLILDHGLA